MDLRERPPAPVVYAPRSQRLFGQILDGIVATAPLAMAVIVGSFWDAAGALLAMASLLWGVLYYFLADGLPGGQSLGKKWLGMQVVNANTGAPCTFGQSFLRNLLLAVLGPIDWVFIFGEQHQRLGDKAANTIVILD